MSAINNSTDLTSNQLQENNNYIEQSEELLN